MGDVTFYQNSWLDIKLKWGLGLELCHFERFILTIHVIGLAIYITLPRWVSRWYEYDQAQKLNFLTDAMWGFHLCRLEGSGDHLTWRWGQFYWGLNMPWNYVFYREAALIETRYVTYQPLGADGKPTKDPIIRAYVKTSHMYTRPIALKWTSLFERSSRRMNMSFDRPVGPEVKSNRGGILESTIGIPFSQPLPEAFKAYMDGLYPPVLK